MSCLPVCCLRATTCLAALIAIAVGASPAGAQDLLEIVKRSTVLIDRGAHGSGSGFCVSAKGMFVTNAHVVKGTRVGGQVGVVIGAATADQQVLEARVVMIDEEHDLALLSSEPVPGVAELTLGGVEELRETQELTVLGYPFGRLLSYGAEYPAISVNVTRVSALRKEKGALSVVQIDGSVNPGNSGGPVVNQNGQVVAVISAGIPGSGVSFAIPATVVEKFLMRPALVMNLQECRYAERQNPIDFGFESICLNSAAQPNAFELTIDAGEGPGKPIKLTLADMKRKKKIKLLSRSETQAETLLLIVRRGADFAYVKTTNHDVKVGAKAFSLLDLRKLERRTVGTVVTMASGDKYAGTVSGWTDAERAGATIPLDDADRIDVYSLDPLLREVKCTLIARKAGKEVGKVQETVEFLGAPQQLKRSVVEKFLKELGPETAEQQALRARLREVRDTPEKIATWEARRKQSPKNWSVLEASSLVATDTASPSQFKFERQADGSYFVTGPQQASIYVFRCALPFPAAKLTAIRLEAIPDPRLPLNGSGRAPDGNFVVSRLDLSAVDKETRVSFRGIRGTADYFQLAPQDMKPYPPIRMLDEDDQSGWAIGLAAAHQHEAVIEFAPAESVDSSATEIEVKICNLYNDSYGLGRFRLSATEAPRPVVTDRLPDDIGLIVDEPSAERSPDQQRKLQEFFSSGNVLATELEQELTAAGGAAGTRLLRERLAEVNDTDDNITKWEEQRAKGLPEWKVLEPTTLRAGDVADASQFKFERQEDGSYFVTGPKQKVAYVFHAKLPFAASKLTAFRIEVFPDERLGGNCGRAYNGNFVLSKLDLRAGSGPKAPLFIPVRAMADYFQYVPRFRDLVPTDMFDSGDRSGWAINEQTKKPHEVVIEVYPPEGAKPDETEVVVIMHHLYDEEHSIGRFRISVTDGPRAVLPDRLSPEIAVILKAPREKRSAEQRTQLREYFGRFNLLAQKLEEELKSTPTGTPVLPQEAFTNRRDPYAPPIDSFEIECVIDGSSSLWVTRDGLRWQHHTWNKPGAPSANGPFVKVNGAPWYLVWADKSETEGKELTELYPMPLGPGIWDFTVLSVTDYEGPSNPGRGVTDQDVFDDRTEMDIDDNAFGAGVYRVRFTRRK